MRIRTLRTLVVLLSLVVLLVSCASMTTPTAPSGRAILLVRVLDYRDQTTPIAGATVSASSSAGAAQATTGPDGVATIAEPCAVELTVRAAAPGFVSFAAVGTLGGNETWTFWLERDDASGR